MSDSSSGKRKEITNVPGASGYSYKDMSSLVIQTDRSGLARRDKEAGSDMVESLYGRVSLGEMGSRAGRESAPLSKSNLPLGLKSGGFGGKRLGTTVDSEFEGLKYKPKSKESRLAYEHLLAFLQVESDFSDQPAIVLKSAADEVLTILKSTDDKLKDLDRKGLIEEALDLRAGLSSDRYSQLVNLGKRITDYSQEGESDGEERQEESVAVVFEGEEEEEDEDDEEGLIPNLAEEEDEEDEAELEKSLPIAKLLTKKGEVGTSKLLDIESLAFPEGGHTMTNKKCVLPEKSFKVAKKGYEEIHVPAPEASALNPKERLIPIKELPEWAQLAFPGTKSLNRIQSQMYSKVFGGEENVLLCAPTGAGKTNVALLAMLQEIGKHLKSEDASDDSIAVPVALDQFKIVYVAPMKALVQEMVRNFTTKLAPFGIKVAELTGDAQLTKAQLADTQLIITTPEKWDVVTRKSTDASSFTRLVRLIIIDEIHLLHDDRGPVLESLVTRTLRQSEQTQEWVRMIGLSATLPNYLDVAKFLRVDLKDGVFFFDSSYRPCPLAQQFIGITEKKPLKAVALMNEICYEKALLDAQGRNQMLIFVHSRKETSKCAKAIRDRALEEGTIGKFLSSEGSKEEIAGVVDGTRNADLKDLLPYGFAIHHAGMTREDRNAVEDLFASGHLQVLVSTATLAWGVNLPAHSVIIRGTRVYSPERGTWTELSAQDVLQMLGRAGRPQYDTFGTGIIITAASELQYYMSLMNSQLPIESQFIKKLIDNLNAEVVLGMVKSVGEAVDWLGYSFLYVRMLQDPHLYGVPQEEAVKDDPQLRKFRERLIHSAASALERASLVKYDRRTGTLQATEQGRIASYYYLTHQSMLVYGEQLRPTMDEIDLFRMFSMSSEFKLIPIRAEEKIELAALAERVPIPVKENPTEDPLAKVNILLQAYISQLSLEGFALISDLVYITQSAGRLWRAIFEIALRRGWSRVALKALDICKMVERRQWKSHSPLRQLDSVPGDLIRRLERKDFPFDRLFDLNPAELGELVRAPKQGVLLHSALRSFPRLSLTAHILPLTRSLLRIELSITPEFTWPEDGRQSESFWIIVEDVDGERVLHSDSFILRRRDDIHYVTMTVPILDPLPPLYFVRVVSDRWLHCESKLPVSLMKLVLPSPTPPSTNLLDLTPLTPSTAFTKHPEFVDLYADFDEFNAIQTQVFPALYRSDENVFVGAPAGSDSLLCAEFALLRLFITKPGARAVYLSPIPEVLKRTEEAWNVKFASLLPRKIVKLTGEIASDLKLLEEASIALATPHQWDLLTRRWKQRRLVQSVSLVIADQMHYIGQNDCGPVYEVALSRTRYISTQLEELSEGQQRIRLVALSEPLANAQDVGDWLGCPLVTVFNFDPSARPCPLRIQLQGFQFDENGWNDASLLNSMTRPAFDFIRNINETGSAIVYVEGRKQARVTAADLITFAVAEAARNPSGPQSIFACNKVVEQVGEFKENALTAMVPYGVAYYHESLDQQDKELLKKLYESRAVRVLVVSKSCLWDFEGRAGLVVVLGTHSWEGREQRFLDYPVTDIFQMLGHAQTPDNSLAQALILTTLAKKLFYRQVLYESLPIESHLDQNLADPFNAEVTTRTIATKHDAIDYLTWTFLYRRLPLNPHYYGLPSASHRHISDHLSELVETTLSALSDAKCIQIVDELYVEPLNLGMIAAYYSINYGTIEMMSRSIQPQTRLRGVLQVIAAASEFDWMLPVRAGDENLLRRVHERCPVKLGTAMTVKFYDPHVKAALLLQAHFSRMELPAELEADLQEIVLTRTVSLTSALIDVISSQGWLAPALAAMEFHQMLIQGLWDSDSTLLQLPHFTPDRVKLAASVGCESIADFGDLEDKGKMAVLKGLVGKQIARIAQVVNNEYPMDLEVQVSAASGHESNGVLIIEYDDHDNDNESSDLVSIQVNLNRPDNEGSPSASLRFDRYPSERDPTYWVAIGDPKTRSLLALKKTKSETGSCTLEFSIDSEDNQNNEERNLKVYVVSDCWMGADQEVDIIIRRK